MAKKKEKKSKPGIERERSEARRREERRREEKRREEKRREEKIREEKRREEKGWDGNVFFIYLHFILQLLSYRNINFVS